MVSRKEAGSCRLRFCVFLSSLRRTGVGFLGAPCLTRRREGAKEGGWERKWSVFSAPLRLCARLLPVWRRMGRGGFRAEAQGRGGWGTATVRLRVNPFSFRFPICAHAKTQRRKGGRDRCSLLEVLASLRLERSGREIASCLAADGTGRFSRGGAEARRLGTSRRWCWGGVVFNDNCSCGGENRWSRYKGVRSRRSPASRSSGCGKTICRTIENSGRSGFCRPAGAGVL